jgi:hypothetical protein
MNNKNYTATCVVSQAPSVAFDAVKNFRGWWSEDIEGATDKLGETFCYGFKDVHLSKIKLVEVVPDVKLVYKVIDNYFGFAKDQSEWIDTRLIFNIEKEGEQTKITFTHEGLVPDHECYKICNDAWNGYITKSLYNFITTGKGNPNEIEENGFDTEMVRKWKLK